MFYRVYSLETQSVMLVFSTGFVYYCPFPLLSGKSPPPIPCVNKYTVYTYTVCKGNGEYEVIGGEGASDRLNTCRKIPLEVYFFR